MIWTGASPTVMIMEPQLIEEILLKNDNFKKPTPSPTLSLLLSGLAGYEGAKWAKHRRIMNPAFYLEKLKVLYLFFSFVVLHTVRKVLFSYLFL